MQRGSQTLFKDFFKDEPLSEKQKRGPREMNQRRNECLVARYFFYAKYSGLGYGIILRILSREFFLSEDTLPDVIEANFERLAALKKNPPDKVQLMEKWPHLNWAPTLMTLE
jgi:hypothetical protein